MNQETKHVMRGYYDLFLTMGPAESKRWIEQIDALPHCDKCRLLEEFEWAKEGSQRSRSLSQCLISRTVRELLHSLLERYWELRRSYDGGYYYHYLPDPWTDEPPRSYAKRVGFCMNVLLHQFVLQYQNEPFVDFRFAVAMMLPQERDRICELIKPLSIWHADDIRDNWPDIANLWILKLSLNLPISFDSFEQARQAFDNFVYKQVVEEL